VALLAMQMAFGFSMSTFLLLPKYMARHLGARPAAIGTVMAAFGVASVLALPLMVRLMDRRGCRASLMAGHLIMAVGAFGFMAVEAMGVVPVLLRGLQGVAWTMVFNAGMTISTFLVPRERMAQAIGIYGTSNLVTNALAPPIAEPLIEMVGARPVFAAAGVMALIAFLLTFPVREPSRPKADAGGDGLVTLLRRPPYGRLAAIIFIASVALGVMFTFYQPFALALGMHSVGGFFVGYTAGAVGVRIGAGRASDRFGHRRVTIVALLWYAVVVAGMSLLRPGLLGLFGVLYGLAHGLFLPAFMALSVQGAGEQARGRIFTLMNGCLSAGMGIVPLLGLLVEGAGYPLTFLATGALVLAAALSVPRPVRVT
jgi:MFS family permease